MVLDPWLPIGYALLDGGRVRHARSGGADWQIVALADGRSVLLAQPALAERWISSDLVGRDQFSSVSFGPSTFLGLVCDNSHRLDPVNEGRSPNSKVEALAFAEAMRATRRLDASSPLQDALYVEKISRLLPTHSISPRIDDDVVLGMWLTGGVRVSVTSTRRLQQMLSWLPPADCMRVVQAAGLVVETDDDAQAVLPGGVEAVAARVPAPPADRRFELPGRPALEGFFNEHVIDIVKNRERYRALGILFPSAVVLHGPPGCGKTFAIEQVVEFLGWPSFQIDASSVASPYIHETSRKVAEVFDRAMKHAPSVLIIDEMEAFLADREMGAGHHRVEEVAEFLRRIPEAIKSEVWVVAMTNRIDMIDPAILRRGRFDHVLQVDYATAPEIETLLNTLLAAVPTESDVRPAVYAQQLAGRPLSDVAFAVREGARLAAKNGKPRLDDASLRGAIDAAVARGDSGRPHRRIGFSEGS